MELIQKFQEIKQHFSTTLSHDSLASGLLDKLDEFETFLKQYKDFVELETKSYKKLFENAGDYLFILDRDGYILSVNSAACKRYGMSHEQFQGLSILEVDAVGSVDHVSQNIEELLQTGSSRFESVHKDTHGDTFTVDIIAQQIIWDDKPAYLHVCRDISQQAELQRALNESEIQMKKIIDQISDGIIIFEPSGKIIIWNSGMEKVTGVSRDNALGRFLYDVQYEMMHGTQKDKASVKKMFDEVVNRTNPDFMNTLFENEIVTNDRGVRTIQAIVFPIELGEGKWLFGSVLRDITEIKRYQDQLRELVATRDKIFSIIAHDLRTPFNSIIGFTSLLLENFDKYDEGKIKKILQYINLSAKPTLDVLTNLLNWVNVQTGKLTFNKEAFQLKPLAREVVEMMTPAATIKNVEIVYDSIPDLKVCGDINMLKSVLQNLIGNAIKFSFEGGTVKVLARQLNDTIEVEVADEGMGMDEEHKEALFSPNAHKSTSGTLGEKGSGLGLILCREFIEQHGGTLRVESTPGEGSRFLFTIPETF